MKFSYFAVQIAVLLVFMTILQPAGAQQTSPHEAALELPPLQKKKPESPGLTPTRIKPPAFEMLPQPVPVKEQQTNVPPSAAAATAVESRYPLVIASHLAFDFGRCNLSIENHSDKAITAVHYVVAVSDSFNNPVDSKDGVFDEVILPGLAKRLTVWVPSITDKTRTVVKILSYKLAALN